MLAFNRKFLTKSKVKQENNLLLLFFSLFHYENLLGGVGQKGLERTLTGSNILKEEIT